MAFQEAPAKPQRKLKEIFPRAVREDDCLLGFQVSIPKYLLGDDYEGETLDCADQIYRKAGIGDHVCRGNFSVL